MTYYIITVLGKTENSRRRRRRNKKDQKKQKYGKATHTTNSRQEAVELIKLFGRDSIIVGVDIELPIDNETVVKQFYTASGDKYTVKRSAYGRRLKHYLNSERLNTSRRSSII